MEPFLRSLSLFSAYATGSLNSNVTELALTVQSFYDGFSKWECFRSGSHCSFMFKGGTPDDMICAPSPAGARRNEPRREQRVRAGRQRVAVLLDKPVARVLNRARVVVQREAQRAPGHAVSFVSNVRVAETKLRVTAVAAQQREARSAPRHDRLASFIGVPFVSFGEST